MKKNIEKTNVIRTLEQKRIPFSAHYYGDTEALSGIEVADTLGQDPNRVFKTLVTVGASGANYVFLVPVNGDLDLKKAARAVGEKSVAMIKSKELLPLTGYIHGGCSPIGMKKQFITTVHSTFEEYDTVFFSGGKIGYQVELSPLDLSKVIRYNKSDIIRLENENFN